MIDKELFKNLTILYVEDDELIRDNLHGVFSNFCEIILAVNGEDGYEKFLEHQDSIDIVLSDITMPKLSGVDMLVKIREHNRNLPFIFTTAYTDSQYLLQAINLGVDNYAVKPINIKNLLLNVEDIARNIYQKSALENRTLELEQYLEVINTIALVCRSDKDRNITFANDNFTLSSEYESSELVGKKYDIIKHPDATTTFEDLSKSVESGKIWRGRMKCLAKSGEPFFINTTIYPIFDDFTKEIKEFIYISFITTQEVQKEREFKKKVMSNIQESKFKEKMLLGKIEELEERLKVVNHLDLVENSIENQRKKSLEHKERLLQFEHEVKREKLKAQKVIALANEKVSKCTSEILTLKKQNSTLSDSLKGSKGQLEIKKDEILKLNDMLINQSKKIRDLTDLVNSYEKDIEKLKKQQQS